MAEDQILKLLKHHLPFYTREDKDDFLYIVNESDLEELATILASQLEPPVIKKNGGQEVCEQLIEILDKHIDLADASKMEDYRPYNDGAHTAYLVIKKLVEKKLRAIKGC